MGKPNRQNIVEKLLATFEENGYTGSGMPLISKATGLGRGSLYNLFPAGKTQMMQEALAAAETEFAAVVLAPLSTEKPDFHHINDMFSGLLQFFRHGQRPSLWGQLVCDPGGETFLPAVREHYVQWRNLLTKALLAAGAGRGSAASLSERTISGVDGALTLARALEDQDALARGLRTMSVEISLVIPGEKPQQKSAPARTTSKAKTASKAKSKA